MTTLERPTPAIAGTPEQSLLPAATHELAGLSADDVASRLARFSELYEGAMRPATIRGVRSDWKIYSRWCASVGRSPLALGPPDIAAFLKGAVARGLRRATIDRYLFTIRLAYRAAGVADPTDHVEWRLLWRQITSDLAKDGRNRRRPAKALRQATIKDVIATMGSDLRDLRDAALFCLASDTMARREELARARVDELRWHDDEGILEIPSSKTDVEGLGKFRFVSAETMRFVQRWLAAAKIKRGPIFRAVRYQSQGRGKEKAVRLVVGDRALAPQAVARVYQRRLAAAGIDPTGFSGHSTRVGSTHDLVSMGYTAAQIALNGGWKNDTMVTYYARELSTRDSAMADARRKRPMLGPDSNQDVPHSE